MKANRLAVLLGAATVTVAAASVPAPAMAASGQRMQLDLPVQDLSSSLRSVASRFRQQIIFDADAVRGRRAVALKGSYTVQSALGRLLAGSGLVVERGGSGVFVVRAPGATHQIAATVPTETPVATPDESDDREIIVTGSRLRRSTFDSPIPLVSVEKEDLAERGYRDLADALADIPGVDQGLNLSAGQTSTQTNGLSTVSLRGLGQNRTLTLIDGHRTVSNVGNVNAVSLSTIPTFFVDRVEISTGGASAVYGSDAIAGVVNIVTDSDLRGIKGRVLGTATNDGGGDATEYSLAAGGRFLDDRLYVMATGTFEEQFILRATDRPRATDPVSYSSTTNTVSRPDYSSYTPGGRFLASRGLYYYDATGLHSGFTTAANGYNSRVNGTLVVPRQSTSAGGKLIYAFSDALKFRSSLLYS